MDAWCFQKSYSTSTWKWRYKVGTLITYVIRVYVNFYIAANKGSWLGFGDDFIFIFEIHTSALASEPNSGIIASLLGLHSFYYAMLISRYLVFKSR